MVLGHSEGRASLHVSFEELVCEVLSKEGEHEIGALWVRDELLPDQELLHHRLHIRQLFSTCKSIILLRRRYGKFSSSTVCEKPFNTFWYVLSLVGRPVMSCPYETADRTMLKNRFG